MAGMARVALVGSARPRSSMWWCSAGLRAAGLGRRSGRLAVGGSVGGSAQAAEAFLAAELARADWSRALRAWQSFGREAPRSFRATAKRYGKLAAHLSAPAWARLSRWSQVPTASRSARVRRWAMRWAGRWTCMTTTWRPSFLDFQGLLRW